MPRHTPLPHAFVGAPFSTSVARSAGISKRRLDGADLRSPFRGVRTTAHSIESVEQLCAAYAQRMPDHQFFSHQTAARLWHVPLDQYFFDGEPVHVGTAVKGDRIRCVGAVCHQFTDPRHQVVNLRGLRVSDPASTWLQLTSILSIEQAVIAGDAFVQEPRFADRTAPGRRPYVPLEELAARALAFRGRGARVARAAIEYVRVGSESPQESRLRFRMVRAGLPEPQINADIRDSAGRFVARGDLYYPRWKVLVEYDGEQHRTSSEVYERDGQRFDDVRALGVHHIRVRRRGLTRDWPRTHQLIRDALRARGCTL